MKKIIYVVKNYSHKRDSSFIGDLKVYLSEKWIKGLADEMIASLVKMVGASLTYHSIENFLRRTNFLIFLSPEDYLENGWFSKNSDILEDFLFEEKFLSLQFKKPVENKPLSFEGGYCCFTSEPAKKLLFKPHVDRRNAYFYEDFYLAHNKGLTNIFDLKRGWYAWWRTSEGDFLPVFFEKGIIWKEETGYTILQRDCLVPILTGVTSYKFKENFLITKKNKKGVIFDCLNILNSTGEFNFEETLEIKFFDDFILVPLLNGEYLIAKKEKLGEGYTLKKEDEYEIIDGKLIVNGEIIFN